MPGWRFAGITIAGLLILAFVVYRQTVQYLMALWDDLSVGEYGHGYLVLAISAYLIFNHREKLKLQQPCPSYLALPFVLLASLFWLLAVLVNIEVLQSVGLLLLVITIVWAVVGQQAMRSLAFPLLFIIFAIPVWFPLSPLLQDITADVVFWITRLMKIPAFRQENLIVLPAGIFSIEEACSGLRYMLAALTLGAFYAYVNYVTFTARAVVVVIAAAVAVMANILRVFIVVYVGYVTDMQHPWVKDHLMLGWYLFGGLVVLMLFFDAWLYRHIIRKEPEKIANSHLAVICKKSRLHIYTIILLCAVLMVAGPTVLVNKKSQHTMSLSNTTVALPRGTAVWRGPFTSINDWAPVYRGAINEKKDYQQVVSAGVDNQKQGDRISLYIGYYPWQAQGKEVINVTNHISRKKVWRPQYAHAHDRQMSDISVKEQLVENYRQKQRLIWYWYNIGGQVTTNMYEAKVQQVLAIIKNRPQSYVVAVSVAVDDDVNVAREKLHKFITAMKEPLENIQLTEGE